MDKQTFLQPLQIFLNRFYSTTLTKTEIVSNHKEQNRIFYRSTDKYLSLIVILRDSDPKHWT